MICPPEPLHHLQAVTSLVRAGIPNIGVDRTEVYGDTRSPGRDVVFDDVVCRKKGAASLVPSKRLTEVSGGITNRQWPRILIVATGVAMLLFMLPNTARAISDAEWGRICELFLNYQYPATGSYADPPSNIPGGNDYLNRPGAAEQCQRLGSGVTPVSTPTAAPTVTPDEDGGGGGGGRGGGGGYTPPEIKPPDLQVDLTVEAEPVEVGKTVVYIVEITNNTDETMTGLSWRDVAFDGEPTALDDLDVDESVTVKGSFGPVQKLHLPGIILTVAVDSDQTEERLASRYVQFVPGKAKATPPVRTVERSGPSATASNLTLRVDRVVYTIPDVHLGHNIADYTVTLPDGEEVTCNFLEHYEDTGGLTRWGHAISEVIEEIPGTLTQYYQKGAADCHPPVYASTWVTERRLAWDYIGGGAGSAPDLGTEPGLVSEQPGLLLWWGHRISDSAIDGTRTGFRSFFDALGGIRSFGYPKTDARPDNHPLAVLNLPNTDTAVIRQYFQAAVLEYHPDDELQPVKTVLLGDLLRERRYPRRSHLAFNSFRSAAPLQVGQTYIPEKAIFPADFIPPGAGPG